MTADGCKLRSGVTTCLREMGGVEKYEGKVWGKNILTLLLEDNPGLAAASED